MCRSVCRSVCRLRLVSGLGREQNGPRKRARGIPRVPSRQVERTKTVKQGVVLVIALCSVSAVMPYSVQAAPARLPNAVYPSGAHILYEAAVSNAAMDCLWGFLCEGSYRPLFHYHMQDELHRTGGWAQFAGVHEHGRMVMAFELFVSRYDSAPSESGISWSELAFFDLESALVGQGYALDTRNEALLPTTPTGRGLIAVQHVGREDLVVMALWSGTLEIEGIASYHRQPAARQTAWASLLLQVHLANQRGA